MPPKKGKGPAAPAIPQPRDLALDPPLDGYDGALGIDDMYQQQRIRQTKASLVEFSLSEVARQGTAMLDLTDTGLDALPEGLEDLPWVQVLQVTKNTLTNACIDQLACPPAAGGGAAHHVSAGAGSAGYHGPGMLPHLKALDISGNLLSGKLPASLGDVGQGLLEELFADNNMIDGIPDEAAKLSQITWLTLRQNFLVGLSGPAMASWGSLVHLDLRQNRLKSLPVEIGHCMSLEELYLNNNEITELPDSLRQCKALIELHVANNALTAFPTCVSGLTSLEVLDVSTNKIAAPLPAEVFPTLPSLMVLHIACNKIPALPSEVGSCLRLEILNIASTAIKTLPDSITACTHLREIYCNNTPMTTVPAGITSWTKLEAGVWRNAKLKTLPQGIEDVWSNLALLDVQAKGGKATCKILEPVRDKLKDARILGAAWQKPKPKKGKK